MTIKPVYEPSISLGSILTTLSILIAAGGLLFQLTGLWTSVSSNLARFEVRTTTLEASVADLRSSMRQVADAQIKLIDRQVVDATQDQKIINIDKRIQSTESSMARMWERLNTIEKERINKKN